MRILELLHEPGLFILEGNAAKVAAKPAAKPVANSSAPC